MDLPIVFPLATTFALLSLVPQLFAVTPRSVSLLFDVWTLSVIIELTSQKKKEAKNAK